MAISDGTREWLLAAPEPYIRYQAQRSVAPAAADPGLLDRDPFIHENLEEISGWRQSVTTRHDKPGLFFHRLAILADLGVTRETRGPARSLTGCLQTSRRTARSPLTS